MKKQSTHSIDLKHLNKPTLMQKIAQLRNRHFKKHQPERDTHGRFITGHGGHHHHKKVNWRLSTAIVIVVAIAGGLFVFRSFAATKAVNPKDAPAVVGCAYQSFLNRSPEASGLKYWSDRYKAGYNAAQLAQGLLSSQEGQFVAYTTTFDSFIQRMYKVCLGRPASQNEIKTWTSAHLKGTSRQAIFNFVLQAGNKPAVPVTDEPCQKFNKTGSSVKPVCKAGSAGTTKDVSTVNVPESNIYVNKAWAGNIDRLRVEAAKARFGLEAYDDPSVINALRKAFPHGRAPSPGSFRSWDEQNWLWKSPNFSANKPGNSMHEWGLAIDMKCNGDSIIRNRACWEWVRKNGPRFGVYNFRSVKRITDKEAWHFSSNGQ